MKIQRLHLPFSCTFIDRRGSCAHRRMEITGSSTRHLKTATPKLYLRALAEKDVLTGKRRCPQGSLYHLPNKINCWAKVSLLLAPWIIMHHLKVFSPPLMNTGTLSNVDQARIRKGMIWALRPESQR